MILSLPFGVCADGTAVMKHTMENSRGTRVSIIDYGASIQEICVPDSTGRLVDVCLGYDTLREYEENDGCMGAIVGRVANRLALGKFNLGSRSYQLTVNDGENHIHGGKVGFAQKVWQAETDGDALIMSLRSPDGEEGYPGNLTVSVRYELTEDDALKISYGAVSDSDTIINLTSHGYFNLNGHDSGDALGHTLIINADEYTELGDGKLPNGNILPVAGTGLDFRAGKPVGRDIFNSEPQLELAAGYDHNFIIPGTGLRTHCLARGDKTGITMETVSDQPGVQLYAACWLMPRNGKNGAHYDRYHALCLETQHYPNAMACPHFPSIVLRAGEEYSTTTIYRFGK